MSLPDKVIALLQAQVVDAREKYPGLELVADPAQGIVVRGRVGFSIVWGEEVIEDDYAIELRPSETYPSLPPRAFEVEGKIGKDFGHFMADGSLCLGAPVEVRYFFAKHRNLSDFVETQVVPYLFSYSYKLAHGEVPYGERAHSNLGKLEFYSEFFQVSEIVALQLLKLLADGFAPPASRCPCGSKRKLKDCHGPKLDQLRPFSTPDLFTDDILSILEDGMKEGRPFPGRKVLPQSLRKRLRREWQRRATKR